MNIRRKKILIIYCGALSNFRPENFQNWLSEMSELNILADTKSEIFFVEDTVHIKPEHWLGLAALIYKNYRNFDGFVVLHGLDNILFTSSALSFLLQNLSKPVIFSGGSSSFQPRKKFYMGSHREVEIKANIINAVQAATFSFGEVALMFGNRLVRANVARHFPDSGLNLYEAPELGILGRIDFSIRLNEKNIIKNKGTIKYFQSLEASVFRYLISPILAIGEMEKFLSGFRGVIFDFGDLRAIPEDIETLLVRLTKKSTIAIRMKTSVHLVVPQSSVINISGLTPHAGITKFMWALSQGKSSREVKSIMEKNIAGELL